MTKYEKEKKQPIKNDPYGCDDPDAPNIRSTVSDTAMANLTSSAANSNAAYPDAGAAASDTAASGTGVSGVSGVSGLSDLDLTGMKACSATDCTGLIPALPASDSELESYAQVYHYPADIFQD